MAYRMAQASIWYERIMRPSISIAVVMIFMGAFWIFAAQHGPKPAPAAWVLTGLLLAGGVATLTRRLPGFYIGMAAGAALALSGIAGFAGHHELGLPVHPAMALIIGLYLCVRVAMSRRDFR
jgi:hypothetical protein